MALLRMILGVALIALVIYFIWYFFLKKGKVLSKCRSGTKVLNIPADKLHGNSHTNNYSYSIWFYVTDWSYRLSEEKELLVRGGAQGSANPRIVLSPFENNLSVTITTHTKAAQPPGGGTGIGNASSLGPTCSINNFPLQRWVNLIVSLNNRTLDLYLNGKLVRTCILPAPATIEPDAPVILTPGGGFKGWTSNMQYFTKALNPQEAYNIYSNGPNCGSGLFDKYKLKVTYLVNNEKESEFTI